MKKTFAALSMILFLTVAAFSQTDGNWFVDKPIADIRFTGLQTVESRELRPIVREYIGRPYTSALVVELQGRLYATDYFEYFELGTIAADETQSSVIIEISNIRERPLVSEIIFNGNSSLRDSELLDAITTAIDSRARLTTIRTDATAIVSLYRERGYADARVQGRIDRSTEGNSASIVFTVEEGILTTVREIRFSGATSVSDGTLQRIIQTKPQSILNRGTFQEAVLTEDRTRIASYYTERGYRDAEVTDVTRESVVDEASGATYLILTFYITEGEQYSFGGYGFEGNIVFPTEQLAGLTQLGVGDVYDYTKFLRDRQRIEGLYTENGYIYNSIVPQEDRDEETNVISVRFVISERMRAHINNIVLRGNDRTEDYVILRELPFEVGDVFNFRLISEGLNNLYNLQYFSNLNATPNPGTADGLMDLIIDVEERNTGDFKFGFSFTGQEIPISGLVTWSDTNFLGRGLTIGANVSVSTESQSIGFNYSDGWLFGRPLSGGVNLSFGHTIETGVLQDVLSPTFDSTSQAVPDPYDGHYVFSADTSYNGTDYLEGDAFPGIPTAEEITSLGLVTDYVYSQQINLSIPAEYRMSYDAYNIGFRVSTGYTFDILGGFLNLSTNFRTAISRIAYDPTINRPFDETLRANLNRWSLTNTWTFAANWENLDINFNPTRGFFVGQNVNLTGGFLGGARSYIRTDSALEAYFTIFNIPVFENWNFKLIFGAHSSLSLMFPQFGGAYVYLPSEQLRTDGYSIARGWPAHAGNEAIWNNWIELRFPILEQYLWSEIYFEGVGVFNTRSSMAGMGPDNFLFGIGLGLRLTIPQLPLRLYLAKRFTYDENGAIQWQMGSLFPETLGLDIVVSMPGLF